MAWVGIPENNEKRSVAPVAQEGFEDGYLEKADVSWSEKNPRGKGPTGTAIRTGKYIIGNYLSKNKTLSPWREEALKRGYTFSIALPLKTKNKVFGAITIYSSHPNAFDKKEIGLLLELADDLAFGITTIRLRNEHQESEQFLNISNQLLKLSNKSVLKKEYLDKALKYIKNFTRCDYLGVRILKEDGYIPFESFIGYSRDFWESENLISIRSDHCACIRVVAGKPEKQDKAAMTKKGSFYLENSFKFISNLPEKEQERFRGKCISCGFASFAIVPIRSKGKIIGAIHVADKKIGMLPLKKVEFLEALTPLIGEAIEKFESAERVIRSEEKYRELVENANSIIVRLDAEGNITFFNEYAEKFFGYEEKEILGKSAVGTIIPETESSGRNLKVMMNDIMRHPYKYVQNENENKLKSGERVWVAWNNKPILGKNKRLTGMLSIGNDITDRKKKEERLLESYNYLGIMNRKISMLLDLDNMANSMQGKNREKLLEYILKLAINISGADTSALFKNNEVENFELLLSSGFSREQANKIKKMPAKGCLMLKRFQKDKTRILGSSDGYDIKALDPTRKAKYFLILPIKSHGKLKGMLFLGFNKEKNIDNQELEFFDIFAMHVSSAMLHAGII